ncbi:hypothetical protein CRE_17415 [Caenorhabditis remanei]|uniref:DUF38 domain-containing protein n=1 Tax=Caenorhabditis remanei TaxID=31234 RepID=E3N290_CAERE|nr:hypothetical protein CRE_17415 [Caenorhabditis remanei]
MDKPLSYDSLKSVLKHMSLKKREVINRQISELRTVNSRLPYVLENVRIGENYFGTNGRSWVAESEAVVDPEKSKVAIYQNNSHKKAEYCVNKSPEEIWEQLFDEYIRDGTVVRGSFYFRGIPELVKRKRENGKDLKMKVKNLELNTFEKEGYDSFIQFIDLDVLENVTFVAVKNTLAILSKPEIQTCKNLTVVVTYACDYPSVDQLRGLRNQHLQLEHLHFTLHDLQLFVQDWITSGREIGTRFSWAQKQSKDVADSLEHVKTHFGAVEAVSNKPYYGNGITLNMGEDRELVMFCDKSKPQSEKYIDYSWVFEMEVVAITPATGIVTTPDV